MQDFMGKDGFVWFVGVVEDRDDPEMLGRVRVRCLGWHTDSREDLPHTDLPWSTVMAPTNSSTVGGLGITPTALVEGSWIIGFFQDGEKGQHPIIMGSLPGFNLEKPDFSKGFSDPKGKYPVNEGEPDTGRLSRGTMAETHPSLKKRRALKQTKVPIAKKPFLTETDKDSTDEARQTWDELDPKSNTVFMYPFNKSSESEAGHVHEIDDTPGAERLMEYHSSGSHYEIHPDGSKTVKVVGDNYEIIAGKSNVLITGDVNVTIEGTKRELIKGDYVLEVEGDYTQHIGKNLRTKIGWNKGGNKYEEILGNLSFNINDNVKGRIEDDVDVLIGGDQSYKINGENKLQIQKDFTTLVGNDILTNAKNNMAVSTTSGIMSHKSGSKLNIKSASDMHVKSEATLTENVATTKVSTTGSTWNHTSGGDITVVGGPNIHLNP